jgi:hypothetical protein
MRSVIFLPLLTCLHAALGTLAQTTCTTHEAIKFVVSGGSDFGPACRACLAQCNDANDKADRANCAVHCSTRNGPGIAAVAATNIVKSSMYVIKKASVNRRRASTHMFDNEDRRRVSTAPTVVDPCDYANDGSCDVPFFCEKVSAAITQLRALLTAAIQSH